MSKIFFTSDSHAYHRNIAGPKVSQWDSGYRDFDDEFVMTDAIVESYNNVVGENDVLYHLGDWSFGGKDKVIKFRERIKCRNIILVYGNHDHNIRKYYRNLFVETHEYLHRRFETKFGNRLIVMCHYALRVWEKSHHGSYHLYGHSHGSLPGVGRSFDIGWCVWKKPMSLDEVAEIMEKRQIHEVDHHNSKCVE